MNHQNNNNQVIPDPSKLNIYF